MNYTATIARKCVIVVITLFSLVLTIIPVSSCFDPMDLFSVEVLLNKPGVSYSLEVLNELNGVVKLSDNVYMYRSGAGNAVVIVYLEGLSDNVPVFGGEPESYCVGVRIELTNMSIDEYQDVLDKAKENATKWLKKILYAELQWLTEIGVVKGLSHEDIESIVDVAKAGYAGWNRRLVYYIGDGKWHPYDELVLNGLIQGSLIKTAGCRWSIPVDKVPENPPESWATGTTYNHSSTTTGGPGEAKLYDGLAVTIALTIGILAALIALFILFKTK